MAKHELLNNIDHKDLKVRTERSAALGDAVMYCGAFPFEFRNLQAHYPIFFHKDAATDKFHAVALFGFESHENLFLTPTGWDAAYVPMAMEMKPFLIGFQGEAAGESQTVIHVDMDSPRLSDKDGEPIFLPRGGNTPYLTRIAEILDAMHAGSGYNQDFMDTLERHELLEPFTLDIELNDGSKNRLVGFYTINEDKLYALTAEALGDLNDKGYLQPVYMAVASMSNVAALIARKNEA